MWHSNSKVFPVNFDLFSAFLAFAFVSSITPGPNNLMLMSSGANFGFHRTIPHMLGIGIGFTVMIVLVGAGLMQVFDAVPVSYLVLKVLSVAYLLWLAWKIARAGEPGRGSAGARPMTFLQAAAFQWVNPKAWAMALTAISVYAPDRSLQAVLLVAVIFGAVNLPSVSTWTLLGQQIRRVLTNPTRLTAFNITMAALLVASLYPVLFG
ncbi:LysE family translocator [Aliiroseovarius crassostreae]|uniref:LysE family translocator n=1 Tax=Aliiroseovarius crassostreae TaxID=154981 RepID=UPI003C7C4661